MGAYDCDCINNLEYDRRERKTQLSQEDATKGATSDLISRIETVEHLRRMLEATVPNTDYDEGYVDGVEFGISTVSTMPPVQPVATDTNVGDTISRQQAIDALNEYFARIGKLKRRGLTEGEKAISLDTVGTIKTLPSVQPEPKEGEWVQIQRCARDAQPDLECPFCKHRIGWFDMGRYCARCGAKLKGGAG